jgi:DNA-binding NarL/FixJ family response regulator
MAARARRLDGELEIDSTPGGGTRLRLTLPCSSAPPPAPGRARTGVLVAAPRPVVRAGVVRLLQLGEPGLGMVSEVAAGSAEDLASACRLLGPDVLVVAHELLGGDLAVLDRLAALADPPAVVLLAEDCPDERLRAAVAAGVKGCVDPDADPARLVAVVAAAGRGETLLADDQLGRLAAPARPGDRAITPREHEVRRLVARGLTDRQIARALMISAKTVEKHVGSLLRKTGTRNRTMLARLA